MLAVRQRSWSFLGEGLHLPARCRQCRQRELLPSKGAVASPDCPKAHVLGFPAASPCQSILDGFCVAHVLELLKLLVRARQRTRMPPDSERSAQPAPAGRKSPFHFAGFLVPALAEKLVCANSRPCSCACSFGPPSNAQILLAHVQAILQWRRTTAAASRDPVHSMSMPFNVNWQWIRHLEFW